MTRRLLVAAIALAPLAASELRVGRTAIKITPPAGAPLAGYYSHRYADGVHDDLWAKAIVLERNGVRAALVACDLVSIDRETVGAARKLIEKDAAIRPEFVMISATHTHTGPQLHPRFQANLDPAALRIARQYSATLPAKIAEAVRLANAALAPARASAAVGHEESISFYRRFLMKDGTVRFNPGKLNPDIVQPMGLIDPDAAVVALDAPDGSRLATYVNFALHLDTVGGPQYSADYPFTLAKLLGKIHGPEMLTMFTIGAAGNINHIDVKSREPQKGHAEARRIGTVLAGEVLKTSARLAPLAQGPLLARAETIALPLPSFSAAEVASARATSAKFGKPGVPFLEMVQALKVADVADRLGRPWDAEVQVIALGPGVAWVGLPGEIFVELGMAIKKASPFPVTIVVGLANDSLSYVPTRKAFAEGAYEAVSARCAPGCGEALADAAIRLLADLNRSMRAR
jgi:neutral ceramidase